MNDWITGRLPARGESWSWPVFEVTIEIDGGRTTIRAEVGWDGQRHAPGEWYRVDGGHLFDKVLAWKPLTKPYESSDGECQTCGMPAGECATDCPHAYYTSS